MSFIDVIHYQSVLFPLYNYWFLSTIHYFYSYSHNVNHYVYHSLLSIQYIITISFYLLFIVCLFIFAFRLVWYRCWVHPAAHIRTVKQSLQARGIPGGCPWRHSSFSTSKFWVKSTGIVSFYSCRMASQGDQVCIAHKDIMSNQGTSFLFARREMSYEMEHVSCVSTDSRSCLENNKHPGGRLNKKDGLTRYGDSHVKDKTS